MDAELIDTRPASTYGPDTLSLLRAYRNLMVLTVNHGLRPGLYSLNRATTDGSTRAGLGTRGDVSEPFQRW
jgi:hypothetical protein